MILSIKVLGTLKNQIIEITLSVEKSRVSNLGSSIAASFSFLSVLKKKQVNTMQ